MPEVDLVDQTAIAKRAGVQVGTVRAWRRRHTDFPTPAADLSIGPVWEWKTVAVWLNVERKPGRRPAL